MFYNQIESKKLKDICVEQSSNRNSKTILDTVEGIEQDLNKNVWDFELEEFRNLISQFDNKDEARKVLGNYVDYAIQQGYTLHQMNNIELFEDVI